MFEASNRILATVQSLIVGGVAGGAKLNPWRSTRRAACSLAQVVLVFGLAFAGMNSHAQTGGHIGSSLLLLIDASGSMGDPVGGSHLQAKIDAAKQAATAALGRAARSGSVETAVLAFSGDCANPVPSYQTFTRDVDRLIAFIEGLQPGGGTPMADALLFANRFMDENGHASASDRMIMLLADGENDCGDIRQAMANLKASGIIFRHETVGFGIAPNSPAAQDLREIATQSGGTYHHAADATQLADVFMEFVETFTVIDLLGQFGVSATPTSPSPNSDAPVRADKGASGGLLGQFEAPQKSDSSVRPLSHGALAIDANQGESWGWAVDYPTPSAAAERALAECGEDCSIVMRFSDVCAAYAADQTEGSTVYGWANGYDSGAEAQTRAMAECADKGGASCIVRAWGCARR